MSQDLSQRLLQKILAEPEDDVPRQVYADWVAEQGDAARAEFIRVQLAKSRLPVWEPERVRLELRERWLLQEHEARWRAELPISRGVSWGSFERGFVSRAAFADLATLSGALDEALAKVPLQRVMLRWPNEIAWRDLPPFPQLRSLTLFGPLFQPEDIDGLAQCPWLAHVRELDLVESRVGSATLARLLASPHLQQLRALRLPHHQLTSVTELVRSRLPALAELDLSLPTLDDVGSGGRDTDTLSAKDIKQLVAWPGMSRLRSLDLSGNIIEASGLRTLLASPQAAGLKELHLREISERAVFSYDAFAKPHARLSLDVLTLQNGFDVAGANKLAQSSCLADLKVLTVLHTNEQEDGAFYDLAQAPWFDGLRMLEVSYGDALPLLRALPSRAPLQLHTLKMQAALTASPPLKDLKALAASFGSNLLLQLDLSHNRLGEAVAQTLGEAEGLKNLLFLSLRDPRNVSEPAAARWADSTLGKRLVSYELGAERSGQDRLPRPRPRRAASGAYHGPLLDL